MLDPILRQAILLLFEAQKRDVELRLSRRRRAPPAPRAALASSSDCARDRSGHAITVLTGFVAPEIELSILPYLFTAGALIMHIDDHGDCWLGSAARTAHVPEPGRAPPPRRCGGSSSSTLRVSTPGFPPNSGRDLMIAFLTRYFLTRLEKHRLEKRRSDSAWAVYE